VVAATDVSWKKEERKVDMTERERTSTSTAVKDDPVKPDDGVEVFDANRAMPTPGQSGTTTNFNNDSVTHSGYTSSEQSANQHTDLGTASSNTGQGSNAGQLFTALLIIIVIALLLYWIF
jgi:hypothetical protein